MIIWSPVMILDPRIQLHASYLLSHVVKQFCCCFKVLPWVWHLLQMPFFIFLCAQLLLKSLQICMQHGMFASMRLAVLVTSLLLPFNITTRHWLCIQAFDSNEGLISSKKAMPQRAFTLWTGLPHGQWAPQSQLQHQQHQPAASTETIPCKNSLNIIGVWVVCHHPVYATFEQVVSCEMGSRSGGAGWSVWTSAQYTMRWSETSF